MWFGSDHDSDYPSENTHDGTAVDSITMQGVM